MSDARVFVGNLSRKTLAKDLTEYLSQAGPVSLVNLMEDKLTGESRGFAFVEFVTPLDAAKAVEMFHGREFQGQAIVVSPARPRGNDLPPSARP